MIVKNKSPPPLGGGDLYWNSMMNHDIIRTVRLKCLDLNVVLKETNRLYTRRLGEQIVEKFNNDEYFRDTLFCVLVDSYSFLDIYPYDPKMVGKITNIILDETTNSLIAELTIINTISGCIVDKTIDLCPYRLCPVGFADEKNIDDIEIITSESNYNLIGFTINKE